MDKALYLNLLEAPFVAQIVSLEARLKHARGYSMNVSMQIESMLLEKQIAALKERLKEQHTQFGWNHGS